MRTQAMTAAKPKAARSRKPAPTKKAATAAKAPAKVKAKSTGNAKAKSTGNAKAKSTGNAKAKSTGNANGVAAAAIKTSNRGTRSAAGGKSQAGKSQAGKTGKSSQRSGGRSQQRGRSTGTGKAQQQSGAAVAQRQGEGTMSPQTPAPAPMFGGSRQVLIEEVAMSNRGGRRQQGPEPFPFGDLTPSRMQNGAIHGPSFFIPDSENPKRIIAAGRKRHKGVGKVFLTRQMEGPSTGNPDVKVSGTRVWLAPEGYNG